MSVRAAEMSKPFRQWDAEHGGGWSLVQYLHEGVPLLSLCAVAELLVPELVLDRGCLVLALRHDADGLDRWLEQTGGDVRAVEAVVNEVHLWDVVGDGDVEAASGLLEDLARRMAGAWEHAASVRFPQRRARAIVTDEYGPTVTLVSTTV